MSEYKTPFEQSLNLLTGNGFRVLHRHVEDGWKEWVVVEGHGVIGCLGGDECDVIPYAHGRATFENNECFDKWSKAPMSVLLPLTREHLKSITFLGTQAGFEFSKACWGGAHDKTVVPYDDFEVLR